MWTHLADEVKEFHSDRLDGLKKQDLVEIVERKKKEGMKARKKERKGEKITKKAKD